MISADMYQVFDRQKRMRREYYAKLHNALNDMIDLGAILGQAASEGEYLDIGVRDREGAFWFAITRPGMPDPRPGFPRRDLALIDYLQEWAIGVRNHATSDIIDMDLRYPTLRSFRPAEYVMAKAAHRSVRRATWLKRALQKLF